MQISFFFGKKGSPDDVLRIKQSEWAESNLFTVTYEEKRQLPYLETSTILNASGVLEQVSNLLKLVEQDDLDPQDEIQLTCPGVPPILFEQKNLCVLKDTLMHRIEMTLTHKPNERSVSK